MSSGSILSLRHYTHDLIAHSHEHSQLVFGLRGQLDFELDGRGARIERQGLIVVPGGAHHTCGSATGSHCLVFDVPGDAWLERSLGEQAAASQRLLEHCGSLMLNNHQQQLVDWLAAGPVNNPLIAQQGAVLLLASLSNTPDPVTVQKQLPFASFDAYIEQNAAYPLQVADLARLAGLSSARLHARFIAEASMTPMDYIRQRRLLKARTLLAETDLAIGEIASRVGYSSQSAFSAAMLKTFGRAPRALRREPGDN